MPLPALVGTYPHPGISGATMTAGADHFVPWLQRHLSQPRPVAVDIESYGVDLDGYRIKCVVLSLPDAAFVADPRDLGQAALIRQAVDYAPVNIEHKANFDVPSLVINGVMSPQAVDKSVCTLTMARLATPGQTVQRTLDACAKRYLGITSENKITDMFKALGLTKAEGFRQLDIDSPAYLMGAAADGIVTARLEPVLRQACLDLLLRGHPFTDWAITDPAEAAWELEKHQIVNRWGIRQSIRGMVANLDYLEAYQQKIGAQRRAGALALVDAGIDPGNGNHLIKYLVDRGELPPDHPMTDGGKPRKDGRPPTPPRPKTDKEAVAGLRHPIARTFAHVKQMDKISGYLEKARALSAMDGRVHPTLEVLAAVHGRSSMTGLEVHQFPGDARPIVAADPGVDWTRTDWSAQEPMLGMNFAGDLMPIASYERGERIYTFVSEFARIKDKQAKVVLLGGMYGEGVKKLSDDLGLDPGPYWTKADGTVIASYKAAKAIQEAAWSALPMTRDYLERLKVIARQEKMVMTMNGRIVPISSGVQPWEGGVWSVQAHKGGNGVICGSAADMMMDVVVGAEQISRDVADAIKFNMHDEFVHETGISPEIAWLMRRVTPQLERAAGRVPVIRIDQERLGSHWRG